jgi:hypothetical protein
MLVNLIPKIDQRAKILNKINELKKLEEINENQSMISTYILYLISLISALIKCRNRKCEYSAMYIISYACILRYVI